MEIGEVKRLKDELEENIRRMLADFTEQTGFFVHEVEAGAIPYEESRGDVAYVDYVVRALVML